MRRLILLMLAAVATAAVAVREMSPLVETAPLVNDVDDPSIWVNPADAAASLIVGTVKRPKPDGGLAVYNLDGELLELNSGIDRPNNADILGDICITTERLARQLRVYRVHAAKPHLRLLGTVPVFAGEVGERGAPMGIALYRRAKDAALFAVVSRKTGPAQGYLWQYRLRIDGDSVSAEKVREFGAFSGNAEIEAIAVDPERELVYYADENCCVRVYRADPNAADAAKEAGQLAESGFQANREGIAVAGDLVMITDQLAPRSDYHVYRRDTWEPVAIWRGTARSTDGIDAIARPMGPRFPKGFLVAMNEAQHNFHLYALP